MAPRKTAAQKAAEAAEREEHTGTEAPEHKDKQLSKVKDDKSGKFLTIQQLKNKLRNEAEREVLDKHKSEVVDITAAKYKKHGLEYVRRLSDEEKAAKQIEELYAQYPHLRPQLEQQQAQQEKVQQFDRTKLYDAVDRAHANDPDLVQAVPGGALEQFRDEQDHDGYADYAEQ